MTIRSYRPGDLEEILDLFYSTVHCVNAKDYSPAQLDAWAPRDLDAAVWGDSLAAHDTVVAEENGAVVGFGDLDGTAHFDRLYVHKGCQGQGVGTGIADEIERRALKHGAKELSVEASITARPFFEKRGYALEKQQTVERNGQALTNFVMRKNF